MLNYVLAAMFAVLAAIFTLAAAGFLLTEVPFGEFFIVLLLGVISAAIAAALVYEIRAEEKTEAADTNETVDVG